MEKVIKRDGRKVRFNKKKIFLAISKAFDSLNQENPELIDEITNEVANFVINNDIANFI